MHILSKVPETTEKPLLRQPDVLCRPRAGESKCTTKREEVFPGSGTLAFTMGQRCCLQTFPLPPAAPGKLQRTPSRWDSCQLVDPKPLDQATHILFCCRRMKKGPLPRPSSRSQTKGALRTWHTSAFLSAPSPPAPRPRSSPPRPAEHSKVRPGPALLPPFPCRLRPFCCPVCPAHLHLGWPYLLDGAHCLS